MTIRTRSRNIEYNPGGHYTALKTGVGDYDQGPLWGSEVTIDVDDLPGQDHNFSCEKKGSVWGIVNGQIGSAYKATSVVHFAGSGAPGYPVGWPSDSYAQTNVLARANPSRPIVDVLAFLGEMRDFPHMILQLGNFLKWLNRPRNLRYVDSKGFGLMSDQEWSKHFGQIPRWTGEVYLNWKFGWEPLLSDLLKLFDFTEAVDNRIKEIEGLRSAGGLRKKVKVAQATVLEPSNGLYVSSAYQTSARVNVNIHKTFEKWGTVRYMPTAATPQLFGDDLRKQAQSLVFGQNLSISTLWELMPWSWLIDWFSNTGDFLSATRNALGVTASSVNIMEHITQRIEFNGFQVNNYGCTYSVPPGDVYDRKTRVVMGNLPQLNVRLPFLSGDQLSILGALNVSKFRHVAR